MHMSAYAPGGFKHASLLKLTRSVNWRAASTSISSSATGSISRPMTGSSSVCHLGRLRESVFLPVVRRRDRPCCACPDSSCEHEVRSSCTVRVDLYDCFLKLIVPCFLFLTQRSDASLARLRSCRLCGDRCACSAPLSPPQHA